MENSRYLQITETKNLLEDLIHRHANAYLATYPEIKEFSAFERSGTFNYYIGMIWTNDCEKPNEGSLRIRGSHSLTKNKLVELNINKLTQEHSFFPGQIIAFLAEPFQSAQLTVKKILDPMKIAPPLKRLDTADKIQLLIASGPFMKAEVEDWTLFNSLVDNIKSNEATHVVLIGPLVDIENKLLRVKYDLAWRTIFDTLHEKLHDHGVQVYIVPSSRDVLDESFESNYFYPCPRLNLTSCTKNLKRDVKFKCSIQAVADPSQIDLGGVLLEVSSAEILFHMNKTTLFCNKSPGSPFNNIFRHLLVQGIYPLQPNPSDLAVDQVKLAKHLDLDRLGAHIVVLPTRFNAICSHLEGRLIVGLQKCSVNKQATLIEIPKVDGALEAKSLFALGSRFITSPLVLTPLGADRGLEQDKASSVESGDSKLGSNEQ